MWGLLGVHWRSQGRWMVGINVAFETLRPEVRDLGCELGNGSAYLSVDGSQGPANCRLHPQLTAVAAMYNATGYKAPPPEDGNKVEIDRTRRTSPPSTHLSLVQRPRSHGVVT
jgi:hypothetical protein